MKRSASNRRDSKDDNQRQRCVKWDEGALAGARTWLVQARFAVIPYGLLHIDLLDSEKQLVCSQLGGEYQNSERAEPRQNQ